MRTTDKYIGITGVADKTELKLLVERCGNITIPAGYRLNVGVLLSDHTFGGGEPRIARYPTKSEAYDILEMIPDSWDPIIHYNTRSTQPLSEQIKAVFSYGSLYEKNICRAIQLNVKSPDPKELRLICQVFPELNIVMQVPIWREDLSSKETLLSFIDLYKAFVTHFLFDPSGGRGTGLSIERLLLISSVVQELSREIGIAVAGGLSGENVAEFCSHIYETIKCGFSIDAEGKLRGGKFEGRKVRDRMNPDKVHSYISKARNAILRISKQEDGGNA